MKRDKKGKFVTHVPGPELGPYSPDEIEALKKATGIGGISEPTAADLDRHQENVEAENQARMDTERKQATESSWQSTGCDYEMHPLEMGNVRVGETLGPVKPTPYGGIALFSASLAILAILGTLWAVYYVIRPKLDGFRVVITATPVAISYAEICPANQTCLIVAPHSNPTSSPEKPAETLTLKGPVVLNSTTDTGRLIFPHSLQVSALENVWLKVENENSTNHAAWQASVKPGKVVEVPLFSDSIVTIRSGKPDSLKFELDGKEIHPENKYHGGGNLAEYVLDGKELLAGK